MLRLQQAAPVVHFPSFWASRSQNPAQAGGASSCATHCRIEIDKQPGTSQHGVVSAACRIGTSYRSIICVTIFATKAGRAYRRRRRLRNCAGVRFECAVTALQATGGAEASPVKAGSEEEEEDDGRWRQATPREKQFGYYNSPGGRSSSSRGETVSLPLSQLHIVAVQKQLALLMEIESEVTDASEIVTAWVQLIQACQQQAPILLKYWNVGVSPLLRLAAFIPRSQWIRSPADAWAVGSAEKEVPDTTKEGPMEGAELMPQLEALIKHLLCEYDTSGVLASGFIWNDGGGGVLRESKGREVVLCSGAGLQMCARFIKLYAALGGGKGKPVAIAKEVLNPVLTKKMVSNLLHGSNSTSFPRLAPVELPDSIRHVQPAAVTLAGPLAALRKAQVMTLGGSEELALAIAGTTRLGKDMGSESEEEFASTAMAWACQFADAPEFQKEGAVGNAVEWLLSQHSLDPSFSLYVAGNPRAPKKVLDMAERAAASLELHRLQTSGQRFQRNPAGIKGFVKTGVMASFGSPFDVGPKWVKMLGLEGTLSTQDVPNSWHGDDYVPSETELKFIADPSVQRKATVRVDEIMSFEYLQHVGQQMRNCLRVERRGGQSLMKYLSRVRARDSSFWVMTITSEADEEDTDSREVVQELLMIEVYNDLKIIHQAEGPHPRRWPRPDAWRWLQEWAEQQGLRPDGPEGVTVGPYEGYEGRRDRWDISRCFLW